MDQVDQKLLNALQDGIPITQYPFEEIGEQIGITGQDVIDRIDRLMSEGLVRRIGPSFNPRKLGYTSTLVAAKIKPEDIDNAADYINRFTEITHNYQREHDYNMWFTVIARDENRIDEILTDIKENTDVLELKNLPATHFFKLKVKFKVGEDS